jgi:hypothetical protein
MLMGTDDRSDGSSNSLARIREGYVQGADISTTERRARATTQRFAVERRLSLSGGFGEQRQKKLMRFLASAASGLEETAQHAVILKALVGASAVNDLSHDDQRTQTALGLIICRRHMGTAKAGEEQLLLGSR